MLGYTVLINRLTGFTLKGLGNSGRFLAAITTCFIISIDGFPFSSSSKGCIYSPGLAIKAKITLLNEQEHYIMHIIYF